MFHLGLKVGPLFCVVVVFVHVIQWFHWSKNLVAKDSLKWCTRDQCGFTGSITISTDFAAALCDPIAYHQEEKRQEQLKSLLDEEDLEDVGFFTFLLYY